MHSSDSRTFRRTPRTRYNVSRGAFQLSICLAVISSCSSHLLAEEAYNNLDATTINSWWGAGPLSDPSPDAGPDRTSQQFDLGGNNTVTEVALQVVRFGTPTGSVTFEIWEDDGFGYPGQHVGTLGSIEDISTFEPGVQEFGELLALPNEATISFDTVVSGLNPQIPHHVVIDYSAASGVRSDGFNWAVAGGEDGSGPETLAVATEFPALTLPLEEGGFGATPDLFSPGGDWIRQSDIPVFEFFGAPPDVRFANFKMSVEAISLPPGIMGNPGLNGRIPPGLKNGLPRAVPEPSSWILLSLGLLGMGRIRSKR